MELFLVGHLGIRPDQMAHCRVGVGVDWLQDSWTAAEKNQPMV